MFSEANYLIDDESSSSHAGSMDQSFALRNATTLKARRSYALSNEGSIKRGPRVVNPDSSALWVPRSRAALLKAAIVGAGKVTRNVSTEYRAAHWVGLFALLLMLAGIAAVYINANAYTGILAPLGLIIFWVVGAWGRRIEARGQVGR